MLTKWQVNTSVLVKRQAVKRQVGEMTRCQIEVVFGRMFSNLFLFDGERLCT
jgi:hypothetical protein